MKKVFWSLTGLTITAILLFSGNRAALSFDESQEAIPLIQEQPEEGGLPKGWRPLTFPKIPNHTLYTFIHEEKRGVIKAESHQSASGLYVPVELNPKVYSVLSWCWKVNRIIEKGDETKKAGDDYAARIYVTFKYDSEGATLWERTKYGAIKMLYGEYPPKAAINYVWANRLQKGKAISNPYTNRAEMVAVESGPEWVGQWRCEERNIYEDYQRFFKDEPPPLLGVAVMTDTDNTREEAIAYYSGLVIKKSATP
ncbi:MAG: DUF3047 domain-containing protein [Nitrospirae bacterium]|nr:DUF3047 domain-containing protein [Nitrospirota bacterium]